MKTDRREKALELCKQMQLGNKQRSAVLKMDNDQVRTLDRILSGLGETYLSAVYCFFSHDVRPTPATVFAVASVADSIQFVSPDLDRISSLQKLEVQAVVSHMEWRMKSRKRTIRAGSPEHLNMVKGCHLMVHLGGNVTGASATDNDLVWIGENSESVEKILHVLRSFDVCSPALIKEIASGSAKPVLGGLL